MKSKEFYNKLESMKAGLKHLKEMEKDPELSRRKYTKIKHAIEVQEARIKEFDDGYSMKCREDMAQCRLVRPIVEVGFVQEVLV